MRRAPQRFRLRGADRAFKVWMTRLWPGLLSLSRVVGQTRSCAGIARGFERSGVGSLAAPAPPNTAIWYHCQRCNPVRATPPLRSDIIFGRHRYLTTSNADLNAGGLAFRGIQYLPPR